MERVFCLGLILCGIFSAATTAFSASLSGEEIIVVRQGLYLYFDVMAQGENRLREYEFSRSKSPSVVGELSFSGQIYDKEGKTTIVVVRNNVYRDRIRDVVTHHEVKKLVLILVKKENPRLSIQILVRGFNNPETRLSEFEIPLVEFLKARTEFSIAIFDLAYFIANFFDQMQSQL